jgi:hypothetical protein
MNLGRIVIGGLLAGLLLNIGEAVLHGVVLASATEAALTALGHPPIASGTNIAALVLLTFVQGVVGVWLYAALIPRFTPGFASGVFAGLVVWFLSAVYAGVYLHAGFAGLFPVNVVWLPVAWEFVEYPLAIAIGTTLYRER